MTKYYVIYKENKDYSGWSVKLEGSKTNFTPEIFETIGLAEKYITENYKSEHKYDRPRIDHEIAGHTGHLMPLQDWKNECDSGGFIDYDGYGDLITKDYRIVGKTYPSQHTNGKRQYDPEIKYILWYNR